jgi:hypothetical protein
MPPKSKKKRASLKLDDSGQIKEAEPKEVVEEPAEPPVRQVVEVVEEEVVPEAIETIKKDAEEIEDAIEEIETEVEDHNEAHHSNDYVAETPVMSKSEQEESKSNVESLFVKTEPGVTPEITVVGKRGPSLGVWVGAMLGVALAIGVSLILLVRGPSTLPFLAAKPTPTPIPTVEPTPTPASEVNKSDIKVSVLNGGGTPGAGSKMKAFLEDKGYTVVSVSNAKDYTYTETEVLVKSGKDEYGKLLTEDLKADYTLGTSSASVDESAAYDAQVIVGKE